MTLDPAQSALSLQPATVPIQTPRSWRTGMLMWLCFLALGTATQLGFKVASKPLENLDFGLDWLRVASTTPAFALAVGCYLATFALWIVILQRMPLSRAFLLTALVYVTVTIGSALGLGESVNIAQLVGIGLVILGVALLGVAAPRA